MDQQKVGQFLRELRNEKSVTQAEIAEVLGVSNRSISRWENGTTMPDFDLLIEMAKYYGVEVGEILEGKRKEDNNMDKGTERLMLQITDYNNVERKFFSKRMCIMFAAAIAGMVVFAVIDILRLSEVEPYNTIASIALGLVLGVLITGFLYASRYIAKIKEAKTRLLKSLRMLK